MALRHWRLALSLLGTTATIALITNGCFPDVVGLPCSIDTNCPTGQFCDRGICSPGRGNALDGGGIIDGGAVSDGGEPLGDGGTAGADGGTADAGAAMDGGSIDSGIDLSTGAKVLAYLEGKTMVMEGDDIPPFPHGYSENMNLGSVTQCYHQTSILAFDDSWTLMSQLGTLQNAPTLYSLGTCDRTTASTSLAPYSSTDILVDHVQGNADCFDITTTFTGFMTEGRGKISVDGTTVTLEIYFAGKAANHRCINGAVGTGVLFVTHQADGGVSTTAFAENAQQVYRIQ
jgi:hypothetical protein